MAGFQVESRAQEQAKCESLHNYPMYSMLGLTFGSLLGQRIFGGGAAR
jgi:hypothetical protein